MKRWSYKIWTQRLESMISKENFFLLFVDFFVLPALVNEAQQERNQTHQSNGTLYSNVFCQTFEITEVNQKL